MKKLFCVILIITLLAAAVIFPSGCGLLKSLFGIGSDNSDQASDGSSDASLPDNSKTDVENGGNVDKNDNGNNGNVGEDDQEKFEDFGFNVITVELDGLSVSENGNYNSKEEVGAYIYLYRKLPDNYRKKSAFDRSEYTSANKLSVGGDRFYNKEGLLPEKSGRTYTECDIDYRGGSRNAKRIVFSSDFLIFYTDDHYGSFSIMRFV